MGDIKFRLPSGRSLTAAQEHIAGLDEATGARPNLSILTLTSWIAGPIGSWDKRLEIRAGGATSSFRCLSGGR